MNRPSLSVAAALALAGLPACHSRSEKAALPQASVAVRAVRVEKPATRLETGLARATGTVRAKEEATLSAKGTGQIKRLRASVGEHVRAGEPLVEMDPVNAAIGLENAKAAERLAAANLAAAEREVARSQQLYEAQSLPEAGFDRVKTARDIAAAQLDQARAALRGAQQQLTDATLVAPFDGVITAKYRNAGDTVTLMPVTPILTLTDVDHLEVRLAVPEAIESFVRPGQPIEGVLTPSGQRFAAKVRVKGTVVDPNTRTIEVLADVVKVDGPPLRPGSLANVDFGGFADRDGLFVPTSAVQADAKGKYVLVVVDGKAARRDVDVAPINPGTMAVRAGLDPAAEVVLDPGTLAAGEAVVPLAN
ncbi:MAG TPA: efflux RND transporter periplasmic adaptor subunit [Anaeromyxobacteraceae bacterium]|nr:efflux RND transporter periplasmic adaptor subunit [Anaeromyxobacteraceae bacterium]